ncbi:hypothetical protein SFRURICE_002761 [Spodoptera frugiperda]|nr:hypothetical protein SFRURICE_002761 [Spodoptera frugiperda]
MHQTLVILCLLQAATAIYYGKVGNSSCLMYNGTCVSECPEHMHRVNSECRPTPSQRSCDEPVAISMGIICGWSRCDCDFPFVLHLPSGYCFLYEDCPKPLEYRPRDNYELNNLPRFEEPQRDIYDGIRNKPPAHMTGYTGYVPGMNFSYGKSYGRTADDCMANFTERQRELRRKADLNRSYIRSRSAPKMETVHSRDEIRRDLNRFREINKYKENTISPEFPPIAGYTGHIPRIKGSEASLSQRYHCAAKRGLELIKMERENRKELQNADTNIKAILKENGKKYSYWNWG